MSSKPTILDQIRAQREDAASGGPVSAKPPWKVSVRRFFAWLIDQALFVALGFSIVTFAKLPWLEGLGQNGWWVGLSVVAIYFTIMDSRWGGGQTLGKRLLGIKVLDLSGRKLHPIEALIRFSPFIAITIIANEVACANQFSAPVQALDIIVLLITLAIPVLLLAHPQRRTVQDLISGSIVVRAEGADPTQKVPIRRPLTILAIVCVSVSILAVGIFWLVAVFPKTRELASIQKAVGTRSDVCCTTVIIRSFSDENLRPSKSLAISAYMPKTTESRREPEIARQIYDSIPRGISIADDVEQVTVTLVRGYDLGIFRKMNYSTHRFPVLSLRKNVTGAGEKPEVHYKVTPSTTQKGRLQKPSAPAAKGAPVQLKK